MDEFRYTEKEILNALRAVLQKVLQNSNVESTTEDEGNVSIGLIEEEFVRMLRDHSVTESVTGSDPEGFWGALCSALSDAQKKEIILKLFPGYTKEEIIEAVRMLECLYDNGMSLSQTSESLHMHKNTLNYRLNRLTRTTGLNPRSAEGAARYQMCVHIFNSMSRF